MKDLREHWEEFSARLQAARRGCLLTGLDGTIVPLADRPEEAALPAPALAALRTIASNPRVVLGVVSGRSLDDLRRRIDLAGIWLVGNHGFEIVSPDGRETRFFSREEAQFLEEVRQQLAVEMAAFPGIHLEPKGPMVAVHTRSVREEHRGGIEAAFLRVMNRHQRRLMMGKGNRVLEARLRGSCNKGSAVRFIRESLPMGTLVTYFGDYFADADAFRAVRGFGLCVSVGSEGDLAEFRVPDPATAVEFLLRIDADFQDRRTLRRTRLH